jgi:hypothetical protein
MKVDLESLAAEAELYRAGKTRTYYPIDFKKAAVSALRQHRYEVLVKRLGIGLSTLQKWKRRYDHQVTVKPNKRQASDSFTFAPILASRNHNPLTKDEPTRTGNITLEFTDQQARTLKLSMPWDELTANKVFKLIEQNFAVGAR